MGWEVRIFVEGTEKGDAVGVGRGLVDQALSWQRVLENNICGEEEEEEDQIVVKKKKNVGYPNGEIRRMKHFKMLLKEEAFIVKKQRSFALIKG